MGHSEASERVRSEARAEGKPRAARRGQRRHADHISLIIGVPRVLFHSRLPPVPVRCVRALCCVASRRRWCCCCCCRLGARSEETSRRLQTATGATRARTDQTDTRRRLEKEQGEERRRDMRLCGYESFLAAPFLVDVHASAKSALFPACSFAAASRRARTHDRSVAHDDSRKQ